MICPNKECKQKIIRPLILFDGRWICPFCKEDIFPNEYTELKITYDNHEKLLISEKIFNEKWLLNYSDQDKSVYLKKAIKLCSESAYLNNPYALVNLGYYYENGYINSLNKTDHLKMAYLFYNSVCYNKTKEIKIFNSDKKLSLNNIKKIAAKNLYNLLVNIIPQDNKSFEYICGKTLSREEKIANVSKMLEKYGIEPDIKEEINNQDKTNKVDNIFSIMCNNQNQERAPLFGIFKLKKDEINDLFKKNTQNTKGIITEFGEYVDNTLKLKIGEASKEYENELTQEGFVDIENKHSLKIYANRKDDEDIMFYLYFFNSACNTKYFNKKRMLNINKILSKNNNEKIIWFVNNGMYNRFIFSEDDIYRFIKQKNKIEEAVNSLQAYCKNI